MPSPPLALFQWLMAGPFSPHLKTQLNRFFDIFQSLLFCFSLADASRNRGAFNNPHSIFITIKDNVELH